MKKNYPTYEALKKMVRAAGIKTAAEYRKWAREQNAKNKTHKRSS
jgi:hypothetical protein